MRQRREEAAASISPSFRHYLMCGCPDDSNLAPVRLAGWFALLMASHEDVHALWNEHGDELTAEARAAGFTPVAAVWFADTHNEHFDDVPNERDEAREQWS